MKRNHLIVLKFFSYLLLKNRHSRRFLFFCLKTLFYGTIVLKQQSNQNNGEMCIRDSIENIDAAIGVPNIAENAALIPHTVSYTHLFFPHCQ